MSNARPGCLLFAPLRLLMGASGGAAQIGGPVLPPIPALKLDPEDRPALAKARNAADRALQTLSRNDVDAVIRGDVGSTVVRLVQQLYAVGEEIARARRFVKANDPKTLGRERADLEVRAIGADLNEKRALDEAMKSIAEREKHATTVAGEIGVLSARLLAGIEALETLSAKIERSALTPDERSARVGKALSELEAERKDAERALEAFAATGREMARLAGQ